MKSDEGKRADRLQVPILVTKIEGTISRTGNGREVAVVVTPPGYPFSNITGKIGNVNGL
jgi:ribulose-5-phosphate 4-epimerase/fuculose-1-phosphate aldolase